jgi:two-component system response regulator DesR
VSSIPRSRQKPGTPNWILSTERERQILQRAGDGRSSTEIATELHLSEGAVRNYLSEAIAKLGASNRIDTARAKGWL